VFVWTGLVLIAVGVGGAGAAAFGCFRVWLTVEVVGFGWAAWLSARSPSDEHPHETGTARIALLAALIAGCALAGGESGRLASAVLGSLAALVTAALTWPATTRRRDVELTLLLGALTGLFALHTAVVLATFAIVGRIVAATWRNLVGLAETPPARQILTHAAWAALLWTGVHTGDNIATLLEHRPASSATSPGVHADHPGPTDFARREPESHHRAAGIRILAIRSQRPVTDR
jgi:hypothetical protein